MLGNAGEVFSYQALRRAHYRSARLLGVNPSPSLPRSSVNSPVTLCISTNHLRLLISESAKAHGFAACLFFVTLAVYVKTAYPTVPPGDAAELCHVTCSGNNMHPPGVHLTSERFQGSSLPADHDLAPSPLLNPIRPPSVDRFFPPTPHPIAS